MSLVLGPDDGFITPGRKVKAERGLYKVVVHGNPEYFGVYGENGKPNEYYTPEQLGDKIRAQKDYKGGGIHLFSCNVGADGATAAQRLSDYLGVLVRAPVGYITFYDMTDGSVEWEVTKREGKERIRIPEKEAWVEFMPGSLH